MTSRSTTPVHIVYIPGLGDSYDGFRRAALRHWNIAHRKVTFVPMRWQNADETYEQKCQRALAAIATRPDAHTVLVGESAGGSVAVALGLDHPKQVQQVITICGKNVRADRVSPRLYAKNPAFRSAMLAVDAAVSRMQPRDASRFTTLYSRFDPVIFAADTKLPHVPLTRLPTSGHLFSIILVLTVFKNRVFKTISNR